MEQAESGLGLDAQLAATHAAISERGWTLAGSVVDAGVSGSVPLERPDHARWLLTWAEPEPDLLVIESLDALGSS